MNIGIDIDNVISNFNEVLKQEFLEHDKELRNTGIINPKVYYLLLTAELAERLMHILTELVKMDMFKVLI